ncbi:MAG: methyltransferase domain-containing protein [Flavobacteriaceae bacterium]|nr:methyltransferase domain-containing protein [Flavobacteriaceae bacterium]
MSILQVDAVQANKIFPARSPEPDEIQILMLFKTPVDYKVLLNEEFDEVLGDGNKDRSTVRRIIENLINEKVLVPFEMNGHAVSKSNYIRADFSSKLSSLGRLMQSVSGDLIAMGDWAEEEVQIEGQVPSSYLSSLQDQLIKLQLELRNGKDKFIAEQLQKVPQTKVLKGQLHLGSGINCPEDWINVDMIAGDMRLNLCWELPFQEDSLKFVYAAHTFEHLDYHTSARRLLKEIHRILKPGGVVRLAVPDMEAYTTAYIENNTAFFEAYEKARPEFGSRAGYRTPMSKVMMMAGSAIKPSGWFEHKMGYDFETLSQLFMDAGFSKCERSNFEASTHQALREIDSYSKVTGFEFANVENSLFIEAIK